MALLNFKKEFASLVKTGQKTCTIRAMRKHPIKQNEKLFLYSGLRTKSCEKLGESIVAEVYNIEIFNQGGRYVVVFDGEKLSNEGIKNFAIRDGFPGVNKFFHFFSTTHGLPFSGQFIAWEGIKNEQN